MKYHNEIANWLKNHPNIISSVIYDKIEELARGYPRFTEGTLRNYVRYLRKNMIFPDQSTPETMRQLKIHQWGKQMQVDMGGFNWINLQNHKICRMV